MSKIKLGTLVVAFGYIIYHINHFGWNYGNAAVFAFLMICIAADCYQMARQNTRDKHRGRRPRK